MSITSSLLASPVTIEVKTIARYPNVPSVRADYLKRDLDAMASRYVEMHSAFRLLLASVSRAEFEARGTKYPEGETSRDFEKQAMAIYLGQSSDGSGNCWKGQDLFRLLGTHSETLAVAGGLIPQPKAE